MFSPYQKFRVRRIQRRVKRYAMRPIIFMREELHSSVLRKWNKFRSAQRFVLGWTALVALLFGGVILQTIAQNRTVLVEIPQNGGRYIEGIVGEFDNLNPLYANDGANLALSNVIFSSLLEYSPEGELVGDVASSWHSNEDGDVFTVELKEGVTWHDGRELHAEDVVFTVEAMKDPAAASPRRSTWESVEVEAIDDYTVEFTLPNAFAPFPHLLRFGILPKHQLDGRPFSQFRVLDFNTQPIGSGPFVFDRYEEKEGYALLTGHDDYHQQAPKISRLEFRFYETDSEVLQALGRDEIDGFGTSDDTLIQDDSFDRHTSELAAGTYLIFNTSREPLKSAKMRQALTQSIDTEKVRHAVDESLPALNGLFLDDQISFGSKQQQLTFNEKAARKKFNNLEWKLNGDTQIRQKKDKELSFSIAYADREPFASEANSLAEQWKAQGVKVDLRAIEPDEFQSSVAMSHNFDAAILSLSNGIDPDVFVFWHSSLNNEGELNFSEVSDETLDQQLEAGRTRVDPKLRREKYKAAAERWRELAPAIGLHQNTYHYIQRTRVAGYEAHIIARPHERFNNVEEWTALVEYVSYRELKQD